MDEGKTEEKETIEAKKEKAKEEKKIEEEKSKKIKEKKEGIKPTKPWYDRNYKKLFFISLAVLVLSLVYLSSFYIQHNDIMFKDVTLTAGTTVTVYTDEEINLEELTNFLEDKLTQDTNVRKLEDITTRRQIAVIVETKAEASTLIIQALEEFFGYELDNSNSSIETTGSSLSQSFYKQLIIALVIAFIFMAIVIFIIFRALIPCFAVILAAITDILGALVIANMFGFHISTAGIAAFLMLIGYSVDTDVMLTTKVIKRRGEADINSRIKSAARTGLIMTITSFVAVLVGFFVAQSAILKQIFFILSAGLFIDLISTWLGNASILKWWYEKKKIK